MFFDGFLLQYHLRPVSGLVPIIGKPDIRSQKLILEAAKEVQGLNLGEVTKIHYFQLESFGFIIKL
jgi:hypothetical protein